MRTIIFAKRNLKELLRDPINIVFCVILPLFFLIIFQQFNIPAEQYSIENFTPGIIIFSYSFVSLFIATLVAKDRTSSLLTRLFASPMKPREYIIGYSIAFLPITIVQSVLFFSVAILFGLQFGINVLITILILIPVSMLFILMGLLIGCVANEKQASPFGSLVVQLVSFTSGMWFPISLAGKTFKYICEALPFSYSVDLAKTILTGKYENMLISILVILIYTIIIGMFGIIIFKSKMKSDNK